MLYQILLYKLSLFIAEILLCKMELKEVKLYGKNYTNGCNSDIVGTIKRIKENTCSMVVHASDCSVALRKRA